MNMEQTNGTAETGASMELEDLEFEDLKEDDDNVESTEPHKRKKRKKTPCYSKKHENERRRKAEYARLWRERNQERYKSYRRKTDSDYEPKPPRVTEVGNVSLRHTERIDYSKKQKMQPQSKEMPLKLKESEVLVQKKKWSVKEKKRLEVALRSHHPDDIDSICQYLPGRSHDEVENYIEYLAMRPTDGKRVVPEFVAPIDNWTLLCDDLARGITDHAETLALLMNIISDILPEKRHTPEASTCTPEASTSTSEVKTPSPDYRQIYRYLADVLDRKPPPTLGPFESAVVVDLLQTLAATINSASVTSQTEIMSRKYTLLSDVDSQDPACTPRIREGWSMPEPVDETDPSVAERLDDSLFNNQEYSGNTFSWPDNLIRLAKLKQGRMSRVKDEIIQARVRIYQNQMQSFSLNPFGVLESNLRLQNT